MNAEIICIGTELLLGETINTNSAYISRKLAEIGLDCYYSTIVGDNKSKIKTAIDLAFQRSDIIITTGGLGPTDDDLTIEAIAEYFNKSLVVDEQSLENIKEYFVKIQRYMPESNLKQALKPEGSTHINNPAGTAPGLLWEVNNKIIISFPGVPTELYSMWESFANDYLKKISGSILITEHLKFFDIPEASLAEKVKMLLNKE